jgi:glycosyltransferase involved in cell wall biosynthesis
VHNAPPAGRVAAAVYAALELICARRADLLLCASADLAARLRRRGAVRVAEFDVPAPPASPPSVAAVTRARAALGPQGRPAVLAVGRLAEQKGLDTLLAAARRWQDRVPAPVLAIAGEGPLAAELAAVAARTGVDLALLGHRDDVPALLAAADVIAVPSRWEARSLVVQEAMRAGRPIVACRVGGIPALTGEDAAILVPPEDAGQLAAAVLAVLDDPGRAARLSAAARDRAAALPGPDDAVAAVLATYRACRPGRPPGGAQADPGPAGGGRRG